MIPQEVFVIVKPLILPRTGNAESSPMNTKIHFSVKLKNAIYFVDVGD